MAGTGNEHWTKMIRQNMEYPAWRALSPHAQALYPWMKLEWKGPGANNNGRIQMSVRQAANLIGCTNTTAAKALRDLQKKGWVVVRQKAVLGIEGQARAHQYELTEIAMPEGQGGVSPVTGKPVPRNLFRDWKSECEFPVAEVRTNNPTGANGKQNPVLPRSTSRPTRGDEGNAHVIRGSTARPTACDEEHVIDHPHVPHGRTPLSTKGLGQYRK